MGDSNDGESEKINLKVLGLDNVVIQFGFMKNARLGKLLNAYLSYARSKGQSLERVRFRFDGQWINENDTPSSLGMEEGDTIDVYPSV